jgi:flagellar M-ring protein FliF
MDLEQLKSRALRVYQGFTPGQRTVTVLALVGLVAGGMMFASWAAKPTLVPLFTSLSAEDAAGITEALTTQGVSYELSDGGSTVLVPQDKVYQLRVDLSAEDLPTGDTVGYDLLDNQGITTSEFRQRIDYQRALEGELSKTITAIEGVEAATVHVVIPEEDIFSEDAKKPTASVLVKTAPGHTLEGQQVQAVVNLIASSVEGLDPTNVTLADDQGTVLSAPGEDGDTIAAGDTHNQQQREYEEELSASVESMLAKVVGTGGASVEVSADLNFDKVEMVSERFGNDGIAVSDTSAKEVYTGTGSTAPTGALGPDGAPMVAEPPTTDYDKKERDRQYAVDKVTKSVTTAPGAVERLSIAVLLDDSVEAEYGTGEIERLVAAAAGLDTARGDTVEVTRLAFNRSADTEAQKELDAAAAAAKSAQTMNLIRTAVILFVILLVLILAYFSMRRATKPKATPVDVTRLQPLLDAERREEMRLLAELPQVNAVSEPATLELPPEVAERVAIQEEVAELIDRQPEEVAQLLRGWLADRRS